MDVIDERDDRDDKDERDDKGDKGVTDEYSCYLLTWLYTITPLKLHACFEQFDSPHEFIAYFLAHPEDFPKSIQNNLNRVLKDHKIQEIWRTRKEQRWRFISFLDDEYPKKLFELKDYPFGIYVIGTLKDYVNVSIIGARNCTQYGFNVAKKFGKELAVHGIGVISGLASGIDGASHQGCLEGKGYTIAVLGSGIDIAYPIDNFNLYCDIAEHGAILSEFPPGISPEKYFFPRRNRIISVLSDFLVVVEARKKSGTLITTDFALEQGRDIGVVPGRPCDSLSQGCNLLLQQGAKCILSTEDILEELNFNPQTQTESSQAELNHAEINQEKINQTESSQAKANLEENNLCSEGSNSINCDVKNAKHNFKLRYNLSAEEQNLFWLLSEEPIFIDSILSKVDVPVWTAIQILSELELKGLVKQNPQQYYYRVE